MPKVVKNNDQKANFENEHLLNFLLWKLNKEKLRIEYQATDLARNSNPWKVKIHLYCYLISFTPYLSVD